MCFCFVGKANHHHNMCWKCQRILPLPSLEKKPHAETTQGKSNHLVILAHLIWQKPRWSSRFLFFCDNKEWNTILTLLAKQAVDWRRVYFSGDILFLTEILFSLLLLATTVHSYYVFIKLFWSSAMLTKSFLGTRRLTKRTRYWTFAAYFWQVSGGHLLDISPVTW